MPSLSVLAEFKSSFDLLGGENRVRASRNLPLDDLPLPLNEPTLQDVSFETVPDMGGLDEGFPDAAFETGDDAGTPLEALETDLWPESPVDRALDDTFSTESADGQDTADEGSSLDDFIDFGDLGDLLGGSAAETEGEALFDAPSGSDGDEIADSGDFGAFLDTIPDDLQDSSGSPDSPQEPAVEAESLDFPEDQGPAPIPDEDFADFNMPSELLDGLGDEIAQAQEESILEEDFESAEELESPEEIEPVPEAEFIEEAEELEPLEEIPEELAPDDAEEVLDLTEEVLEDFAEPSAESDFPEEAADQNFGEENLFEDFEGVSEEEPVEELITPEAEELPAFEEELPGLEEENLSVDEEPDNFDMGGESSLMDIPDEDTGDSSELGDLGIEDLGIEDSTELGDLGIKDSFDNFSLGSDVTPGETGPGSDDGSVPEPGWAKLEEFSLPGIDDDFSSFSLRKSAGKADTRAEDSFEEPEEIQLTEEEVTRLRNTLLSYPLNLRIACEELISEEVVAPDLLSNMIKLLVRGASARETASLAGKILGRTIPIPKGFEKKTGEELEQEQSSFAYIFVHNFLPVLRLFLIIGLAVLSVAYLAWNFIYLPLKAESIYRRGYERISAGEYGRARDLFREAFGIHQNKKWFYSYAEGFRDERQYLYAEEKYDELLNYTAGRNKRHFPDKKAVLDYAALETNYMRNYSKADQLLRRYILDFSVWDRDALLALGDTNLAWGEIDKDRYEDAREAYAKILEKYGRSDPILERMMIFFIRTDNLKEVLPLQTYFMASAKRRISSSSLAELGGYYLDKRTEEIRGVPNEYLEKIEGIRDILLRAVRTDPMLPEPYYHLSRYYEFFDNVNDEALTLERAIQAFDAAREETPRRLGYRINALRRYGEIHIHRREFFRAEEFLMRGVRLYEDGLSRRLVTGSPLYGKLYADLGDLEYFVKDGNAAAALDYYERSEQNGYAPPEIQYRMGAANYQLHRWSEALDRFVTASFPAPFNRKILYALGNVSYLRGNYFAAQAYYDRLLEILEGDMTRFILIAPTNDPEELELAERIMVAQNNLGVTLEALALRTGSNSYRSRAQGLYSESERAWDVITRNPESMIRLRPSPDINAPGINPAYLNVQNSLYPVPDYEPLFFLRIDRDLEDSSQWEELAPSNYRLSEGLSAGR